MARPTGALRPGQRQSFPIPDLTEEDMNATRAIVEGFYRSKDHEDPIQKANTVLYCAVNGVTKDERGKDKEWLNSPGLSSDEPRVALMKRVTRLCGRGFKQFLSGTPTASRKPSKSAGKKKPGPNPNSGKNIGSLDEHDFKAMRKKKAEYIDEFGFDNRADIVLLDRLVRLETVVEFQEDSLLTGAADLGSKAPDNIKKLTDTIVSLQKALGITAEQRSKVKSKSKEGTVAELYRQYEDTKREWPELEQQYLLQELDMLLAKHNRIREDESRELTASEFKRLSRGISVRQAYNLLKRKNPNLYGSEEESE